MTRRRLALALRLALVACAGCAVDAAPIEVDLVVTSAGAAAPVRAGEPCRLRVQPAWRQGVNCQLVLSCGDEDLFGGARAGGYAVCEAEGGALTRALDDVAGRDGDPAIALDALARTVTWRDRAVGTEMTLSFVGEPRDTAAW